MQMHEKYWHPFQQKLKGLKQEKNIKPSGDGDANLFAQVI